MDTTVRNLDETAYRALKARAALLGTTIGEVMNDAMELYLAQPNALPRTRSILDDMPVDFRESDERLSEEIDLVVFGTSIPSSRP
jgi:plasmid stability protein